MRAKVPEYPPNTARSYPIGASASAPEHIQADLTTSKPLLIEPGVDGYRCCDRTDPGVNGLITRDIAIHISRTGTGRNDTPGIFSCKDLRLQVDVFRVTEKLALQVHSYLRAKIEGRLGIHEIKQGVVQCAEITPEVYDRRKQLLVKTYRDPEWDQMALIPGVCQVFVLIEALGATFGVVEVYCDGDRIFPP